MSFCTIHATWISVIAMDNYLLSLIINKILAKDAATQVVKNVSNHWREGHFSVDGKRTSII